MSSRRPESDTPRESPSSARRSEATKANRRPRLHRSSWAAAVLAVVAWSLVAGPAVLGQGTDEGRPLTLSVDDVQRGQMGYGLTVFSGLEPERFDVEVVGVLRNQNPELSFILARLSGHGLEQSGVAGGMSGSPVYLEERLVGAVAFSWDFSTGALAGITPIAAMRELAELEAQSAAGSGGTAEPETPSLRRSSRWEQPFEALLGFREREVSELEAALIEPLDRLFRVSQDGARPNFSLGMGGFGGSAQRLLATVQGPTAAAGSRPGLVHDLGPGSAVAGMLVGGDLQLTVTGTVTERHGDSVLAMGHPFVGIGPVSLPMATAEIVTIVSSTRSSFKLSNIGGVVGAFDQDRLAGLHGRLGAEAPTIPLRIDVLGSEPRSFDLVIADFPIMLPSLVGIPVLQALEAATYSAGDFGLDLRARIELAGREPLEIAQNFDGSNPGISAAFYMIPLIGFLANTTQGPVEIESIEIELEPFSKPRIATIERARVSPTRVRAGERLTVSVDLKAYRGESYRERIEIQVPEDQPPGPLYLFVGDGPSVDATRLRIEPKEPRTLAGSLELLRSFRERDELTVLTTSAGRGAVIAGRPVAELPGSIRSLWGTSPLQGEAARLGLAIVSEVRKELDRPLQGVHRLDLRVVE